MDNIKPSELLQQYTPDYMPSAGWYQFFSVRNRPAFTRQLIREMLTDPRITYGLWLIKGPIISNAKFVVECENSEVKEFVQKNLERFWRNSASRALKAIEWGYSGSEVLYRLKDGRIHFDCIKDFDANDVSPVRYQGKIVGIYVTNNKSQHKGNINNKVYLGGPKCLWHIHWRDRSPWWGIPRLFGAHIPWWEKWCDGGFRDIRRLWYYKNAFEGGTMYHPPGSTKDASGAIIANKDLAREMLEKKRSGATLTLPNVLSGEGGTRAWEYVAPLANSTPEGMLEYGAALDTEILEAMGIPPEIIESGGDQGFGSSTGRQVPQDAFYAIEDELIMWLLSDFDTQCLRELVKINYGEEYDYEILPIPLGESDMGMDQPGDFHENQYLDEEGDAKSQEEIDQEEADRYEKARSESLKGMNQPKGKKSFSMASSGERKPLPPGGRWVTIGGKGSKEGSGFPVYLSKDGTILAGGPRFLKGTNITDSKTNLDKKGRAQRAKETTDPRTPFHDKHNLPNPNTHLGKAIEEYAGKDYEEQAEFLKLVKQVHKEHLDSVANRRKLSSATERKFQGKVDVSKASAYAEKYGMELSKEVKDFINTNQESFADQRDLERLFISASKEKAKDIKNQTGTKKVKNPTTGKMEVQKVEKKSDLAYLQGVMGKREGVRNTSRSKNWSTISKNISETLGIDKATVESEAEELYNQKHGIRNAREQAKKLLREQYGFKANENDPEMFRRIENEDFDQAYEVLASDPIVSEYLPHLTESSKETSDEIRSLMMEKAQPAPKKTDDAFLQDLFDRLSGEADASEVEIYDPLILDRALALWEGSTNFDFGDEGF